MSFRMQYVCIQAIDFHLLFFNASSILAVMSKTRTCPVGRFQKTEYFERAINREGNTGYKSAKSE